MATYAGDIITRFGADLSGLSRGFSQAQSQAASFSSNMQKHTQSTSSSFGSMTRSVISAGAGIGGWVYAAKSAGEAAVGLGQALFGSSANMEQTTVAFKGLLGSGKAADDMMRNLQAFAAKTPFEFPALAKDTQMLLGMGVAAKDVIPWMTSIGDAVAGMGGGPEQIEQVTRALGQMQAKSKIAGDEMMQLQEGGINGYKILAQQMGLTEAQVRKLGDAGKLGQNEINLLVKGMEKTFGGQMAAQAGTFNGLLSTLKDNAGNAMRAFTGPMFETAKKALAGLVNAIDPDKNPGFITFVKVVGQDVGNAVNGVAIAVQTIVKFFTGLHSAVNTTNPTMQRFASIGGSIRDIFTTLGNVIRAVGLGISQGLAPFLTPIVGSFNNLAATTSRVLAPAFDAMSRGIQGLLGLPLISWGQTIGSIFGTVLVQGMAILTGLVESLGPLFQGFLGIGQQIAGFVTSSLIPAIIGLQPTFQNIITLVTTRIIPTFLEIYGVFNQVSGFIRGVFLGALSAILPVVVTIANFLSGLLLPAFDALKPLLVGVGLAMAGIKTVQLGVHLAEVAIGVGKAAVQFTILAVQSGIATARMIALKAVQIGSAIAGFIVGIPALIAGFAGWAVSAGAAAVATIAATWPILLIIAAIAAVIAIIVLLVKNWDSVVKFIQGAWTAAVNWLGSTLSSLGKWFSDTFQGIWNTITGVWNAIWAAISVPLQAIWNGIVNTFSPIITFISDVMRIIGGILSLGWSIIWGQISGFLTNIWNTVVSVWNTIWGFLSGVVTNIWNMEVRGWTNIWNTISGFVTRIWNTIVSVWNTIWGFLSGIITTIWNAEVRGWTNIWNTISSFLGRIWSTITSIWNNIKSFIGSVLSTILGIISNIWNTIWNTITGFVGRIWDTITSTFNRIRDTVGGIFRGMINNIISWLNPGLNAISNFLNFFINGINKVSQFFIKKDLLGTVHLGPIGYLAHGTPDWRGGLAVVGEEGPELVSLPKHAAVLPHSETEDYLAGKIKYPAFADGIGDFFGNMASWFTGGISGIAGNVMSGLFGGAPDLGIFSSIAGGILKQVADWLGQWIKDHLSSLLGSGYTGTLPAMQQGQFLLPPNLGFPGYAGHHGMDFQFPQGSPVQEIVGGTVSPHTGWYSFGGEIDVLIDRIAGMWERYLHMSQIFVQGGQRVNRGDLIGLSGGGTVASGLGRGSNGAHLHLQYDWGNYSNFVPPLNVWSALGMFDPFMLAGSGSGPRRNRPFKKGGVISEQILGVGATSGKPYSFGERGMESVVPASAQERMAQALERLERLFANDGRLTEYQVQQALGRLLASGVR